MTQRYVLLLLLMTLAACAAPTSTAAPPAVSNASPVVASSTPQPSIAPPTATLPPTSAPSATLRPTSEPAATATPIALPSIEAEARSTATSEELAAAAGPRAPTAAPTARVARAMPGEPVRLVIESIGLDRPLISVGLDQNRVPVVPQHDVGWYNLSARPGEGENVVLWGHVLRFKAAPNIPAPFGRLKELEVGATVVLYDAQGVSRSYRVTEKVWATPEQVEYILPRGRELLTMVSCIGDKVVVDNSVEMTNRLITIAEPIE